MATEKKTAQAQQTPGAFDPQLPQKLVDILSSVTIAKPTETNVCSTPLSSRRRACWRASHRRRYSLTLSRMPVENKAGHGAMP